MIRRPSTRAHHALLALVFTAIGCGAASEKGSVSTKGRITYERALDRARQDSKAPLTLAQIPRIRARQEAVAALERLPWGTEIEQVDAGGVRAEWILVPAAKANRVLVYLHGGGYAFGSAASHRRIMALVGQAAQARVLGVDYRLAPEHPFPAALEDALLAYAWLLDSGFEPKRVAFVGDSAGGGLALSTMVKLKERGAPLPAAAVLVSPWVDLTGTLPAATHNADVDPILRWEGGLEVLARAYAGRTDVKNPLISPLRADLGGLPPILVLVGAREILLDDSKELARRLRGFDVEVQLRVWPGMWHGWQFHAPRLPEAAAAIASMGSFLRKSIPDRPATF